MFNLDVILSDLPTNAPQYTSRPSGQTAVTGGANELSDKYIEVSKDKIKDIPVDTYIRYKDADGNLKPGGGRIKEILSNPKGEDVMKLLVFNAKIRKYYPYLVNLDKVSKIYRYVKDNDTTAVVKKQTAPKKNVSQVSKSKDDSSFSESEPISEEEHILNQLGDKMLFNDNELLKQKISILEAEVDKLINDQKKLFIFVKRLHSAIVQNNAPSAE
jgi:hypothetical protein